MAKEVYTARDLREVVGLGRTTIWRLEGGASGAGSW